eukprot:3941915-Rhodomonas_salina.1
MPCLSTAPWIARQQLSQYGTPHKNNSRICYLSTGSHTKASAGYAIAVLDRTTTARGCASAVKANQQLAQYAPPHTERGCAPAQTQQPHALPEQGHRPATEEQQDRRCELGGSLTLRSSSSTSASSSPRSHSPIAPSHSRPPHTSTLTCHISKPPFQYWSLTLSPKP